MHVSGNPKSSGKFPSVIFLMTLFLRLAWLTNQSVRRSSSKYKCGHLVGNRASPRREGGAEPRRGDERGRDSRRASGGHVA